MILITGVAGFIGFQLAKKLLDEGEKIIGVDNLNNYYDVELKKNRLLILKKYPNFKFVQLDIAKQKKVAKLFKKYPFKKVVNLAAQAGVRYSIENPRAYIDSNLIGFGNILEGSRHHKIKHLLYASSSSVYGANKKMPFSTHLGVDHPLSLYAASKRANELMAHSYSSLFNLPTTGLRFFTVYGPWGRPDMALFLFARAIEQDKAIQIFNHGHHLRDFTYIDDIVNALSLILKKPAQPNKDWDGYHPDPATSFAPFRIYNIGRNQTVKLMHYIECLEKELGKTAKKEFLPIQPGDVVSTFADISDLIKDFNYQPKVTVEEGIKKFIQWYHSYYQNH